MSADRSIRHWLWILGFGLAYGVLALFVENSYYQLIMTVVLVWAVMGLAWNILSGYSGLISFGHAAFFGLGAYFVVLAQINWNLTPWVSIPIAGVLGGIAGLIVGVPTFRLRGHYFALAMLAYPLALLYVFEWLGYQEATVPMRREAPAAFMQFADGRVYVFLALALTLGAMVLTRRIEQSRFGLSLLAIKQDETAAEAAGISTIAWKLKAIALSGAMAGAIGGFYAVVQLVVTPLSVFGILVSAQALIVAMFGGVGTVWGPVIGAVTLVPLSAFLDAELAEVLPGIQGVIYGIAIIAVIMLAPDGIFWKARDYLLRRRDGGAPAGPSIAQRAAANAGAGDFSIRNVPTAGPVLEVRHLSKSFGGLLAVNDVSLEVRHGEILGIIGPNGAGKTTLFNLLNGFSAPDSGEVLLNGENVIGKPPNQICRRGVGRTFQVVKPFRRMSIADNVVIGAYVRTRTDDEAQTLAAQAIAAVGLTADAHLIAGNISNKQLRLMELARALASKPRILLLDEIFAGLTSGEVQEVMEVIRRLAAIGITIVIIEHTMQAMVMLVHRFVVLDHGAVLTVGAPEAVTQDPKVIEAYLGKKWLRDA
ncbi:MAG TPA: branched-chain amino acid ABC transporter ATP-binding protein/permease [Gammaproteobacteria bacterium]|nr:branched-chain amino acid ABC transporter ATP-binding protein/permease [Gammaproteobacteria bacterium]